MRKNDWLKGVNVLLLILLMNQAATGLLHARIPHELFEWLHQRAAYVLLLTSFVHLALNWNWVKAAYFKTKK